jgi:hypothetical protein
MISVPVSYFNGSDITGWKSYFQHPKRSYVVALVLFTNFTTNRHEVGFLGAPPGSDPVYIMHQMYVSMRNLWILHGSRMIPSYELKTVFDKNAEVYDFRAGKKKPGTKAKGINTYNMYVRTHCVRVTFFACYIYFVFQCCVSCFFQVQVNLYSRSILSTCIPQNSSYPNNFNDSISESTTNWMIAG